MKVTSCNTIQLSPSGSGSWAIRLWLVPCLLAPGLCVAQGETPAPREAAPANSVQDEALSAWQYIQTVPLAETRETKLVDFVLTPSVFDGARIDLADLRLYDAIGREIPYALRVRSPRNATQAVPATQFNDVEGPDKTNLLSLDLGQEVIEHNEVQIKTRGSGFRRSVLLEGSQDGEQWSVLADKNLLNFGEGDDKLIEDRIAYPPCRLRYLRITLHRDPQIDKQLVPIEEVVVRRRIEVPGEYVTREVVFGEREGVKTQNGPGSAWFIDLGGRHNPVERLHVDIADPEFARDYFIEAAGPPAPRSSPWRVASGQWQRRAGEAIKPMVATFPEQRAARLRLSITDHRNPALHLQEMRVTAAVRQVIFEVDGELIEPVQLFYGNPEAAAPNYDFAKNLPKTPSPAPYRLELEPRQGNPRYQPPPLPLTERLPWLIYVLLGLAIAALGLLIANLARAAIAVSEARHQPAQADG